MTPYADQTFKALLKKYLDDSIESCSSAASLGAWTPTGIDESMEDWELTDAHVREWLMLAMSDVVDQYLWVKRCEKELEYGVHSDET